MKKKYIGESRIVQLWNKIKSVFVAKEAGKGLSTNDYSTTEKNKVALITTNGDGNSYLSNDGTYKIVQSGSGGLDSLQVSSMINVHDTSTIAHADIRTNLDEALTIAKGKSRGLVFTTKGNLDDWLTGNYQRPDGKTVNDLQIGDALYIEQLDVPDYWWNGSNIKELETEKVDLSEYLKNIDIVEMTEEELEAILI